MSDSPALALFRALKKLRLIKELPEDYDSQALGELPIKYLAHKRSVNEQLLIDKIAKLLFIEAVEESDATLAKVTSFSQAMNSALCWKHKVVPLYKTDKGVVTAFANPYDLEASRLVEFSLEAPVTPTIASEDFIVQVLEAHYLPPNDNFDDYSDGPTSQVVEIVASEEIGKEHDQRKAHTAPIIRLCNKIISDAAEQNASDIHIEPSDNAVDIRIRVDGKMTPLFQAPKRLQNYMLSRFKLLAGMDLTERRRPQDGRIHVRIGSRIIDVRVSSIPNSYGEKLVLRLLGAQQGQLSLSSLGMYPTMQAQLEKALAMRGKMILVTGPTGSGKTTTLYSCLRHLCDGSTNIQTVEDPIEYQLKGINQVQVNKAVDLQFATVLRTVLRQDPDVIMIGEIRDFDTAEVAFQAAQTGHLVLSTLHTNDAIATISRLKDIGVEPFVLSSSLELVIAQRLIRRLCPDCKTELTSEERLEALESLSEYGVPGGQVGTLWRAVGCNACKFTGYKGRKALFSGLQMTPELSELIYSNASSLALAKQAYQSGYIDLHQAALKALLAGDTGLDEILPYLEEQNLTEELGDASIISIEGKAKTQPTNQKVESVKKQKVLLVEDSEDIRQVLAMLLEQEMFEVTEAVDGKDALEKVFEDVPDIILCDLMMPRMDGREFLKKMKSHTTLSHVPIVMLTAADSEENEVELLGLGAKDFVSKTSSSNVMITRLKRILS